MLNNRIPTHRNARGIEGRLVHLQLLHRRLQSRIEFRLTDADDILMFDRDDPQRARLLRHQVGPFLGERMGVVRTANGPIRRDEVVFRHHFDARTVELPSQAILAAA